MSPLAAGPVRKQRINEMPLPGRLPAPEKTLIPMQSHVKNHWQGSVWLIFMFTYIWDMFSCKILWNEKSEKSMSGDQGFHGFSRNL